MGEGHGAGRTAARFMSGSRAALDGPLEGVRILDLTSMISGPLATRILGDQGADVIKVEPPGGDMVRHLGPNRGGLTATFVTRIAASARWCST